MIININGRLGKNAEVIQGKSGNEFIKYSVAIDEYNPETKQNDTVWLNVIDGTEKTKKMIQYLTKGKLINLVGNDRVTIFNGQNGPMINHDVRCFNWEFINAGKQDDQANTQASVQTPTVTTVAQPQVTVSVPTVSTGTFKQPTVVTTDTTNSADDLPF